MTHSREITGLTDETYIPYAGVNISQFKIKHIVNVRRMSRNENATMQNNKNIGTDHHNCGKTRTQYKLSKNV